MERRTHSQRAALFLAALCTAIPAILSLWLFLYVFVLPRDRGDAGPANPPDMQGFFALFAACVCGVAALPHLLFIIAAWRRRRWGFIGLVVVSAIQAAGLAWLVTRGITFQPSWMLWAYIGLLACCSMLSGLAAAHAGGSARDARGFPIAPHATSSPPP